MVRKKTEDMEESFIGIASTGNVDWSVFLQEGVIVTLTIKRYRGTTTVDFAELGIDDSSDATFKSFLTEYITPGTKRLIPPEIEGQLKSIETSARQNLKDKGFDCAALASNGKFVPKSMYAEFKAVNEELQAKFYEIRDDFAENYESIIEHVRNDYKVLAENIYMQSHPDAKRPSARYVKSFVDKIIDQIPSADEIVASFEYSTILRRIPENLLHVISKKQDIDERVMRIAATNQEFSSSDNGARKNQVAAAGQARGMASADAALLPDDDAEIDEIEKDIRESIQDQSADMANDFLTDILVRVRSDASEGADAIVKSIEKNDGKLVGRASIKAHSLVDDLQKMNFYGDVELDQHVTKLSEALGTDKNNRDVEAVKVAAMELKQWADEDMSNIHTQTVGRKAASTRKSAKVSKPAKPTASKAPAQQKSDKPTTKPAAKSATKPASSATTQKGGSKGKVKIAVPKTTKRRTIKQRS